MLRQKTKISQRLPDDLEEKITSFQSFVIRARRSKNYSLVNIGNMDETPVWFNMPTSKTVDSVGAKTVLLKTTGHEKTRFTVVLACLADGTKLKPMVIFKRKTMPKDNFPTGIVVHNHLKGWMDESGVKIWIEKVWRARPGGFANTQSLLVWNSFSAHLTDTVKQQLRENNLDCDRSYTRWSDKPRPTSGCLFKQAIQGSFTGKMDDLDDEWGKDIHTGWPAPSSISRNSLSMG